MRSRYLVLIVFTLAVVFNISAEDFDDVFELSFLTDGIVGGTGVSLFTAGLLLKGAASPPSESPDTATLPAIDALVPTQFSSGIDFASTIGEFTALAIPGLLFLGSSGGEIFQLGVMYLESFFLANGIKDSIKGLFPRYRPFMYGPDPPAELLEDDDRYFSFPSGHTTVAFTGASFLSYVFLKLHPNSPYRVPIVAGGIVLAAATAAFRVLSAQHFITDVITGAVIGSVCGVVVPLLHQKREERSR